MSTLPIPTPEELEAEALDLERRAAIKDVLIIQPWMSSTAVLDAASDSHIFREEAASKRAKAERLRKAART